MILTFEATTAEELREKVVSLARMFGALATGIVETTSEAKYYVNHPVETPVTEAAAPATVPTDPKPKRSRRSSKDVSDAPANSTSAEEPATAGKPAAGPSAGLIETPKPDVPAQVQPATEDVKPLTKDDAIAALQKVNEGKGLGVAREVLLAFSCSRISEVPVEKYGAFVAACEKACQAS